jgi:hypothetical protein
VLAWIWPSALNTVIVIFKSEMNPFVKAMFPRGSPTIRLPNIVSKLICFFDKSSYIGYPTQPTLIFFFKKRAILLRMIFLYNNGFFHFHEVPFNIVSNVKHQASSCLQGHTYTHINIWHQVLAFNTM